jgi:hypothetical protein
MHWVLVAENIYSLYFAKPQNGCDPIRPLISQSSEIDTFFAGP